MTKPERFQKGRHVYTKWDKNTREVRVMRENETDIPKKQELQIEIDDQTAQGVYSNLASIINSKDEFIFDFMFVQPQSPKARVRSRVITSPEHARRFLNALAKNLDSYDKSKQNH